MFKYCWSNWVGVDISSCIVFCAKFWRKTHESDFSHLVAMDPCVPYFWLKDMMMTTPDFSLSLMLTAPSPPPTVIQDVDGGTGSRKKCDVLSFLFKSDSRYGTSTKRGMINKKPCEDPPSLENIKEFCCQLSTIIACCLIACLVLDGGRIVSLRMIIFLNGESKLKTPYLFT